MIREYHDMVYSIPAAHSSKNLASKVTTAPSRFSVCPSMPCYLPKIDHNHFLPSPSPFTIMLFSDDKQPMLLMKHYYINEETTHIGSNVRRIAKVMLHHGK
jgi:hypothetical protein